MWIFENREIDGYFIMPRHVAYELKGQELSCWVRRFAGVLILPFECISDYPCHFLTSGEIE